DRDGDVRHDRGVHGARRRAAATPAAGVDPGRRREPAASRALAPRRHLRRAERHDRVVDAGSVVNGHFLPFYPTRSIGFLGGFFIDTCFIASTVVLASATTVLSLSSVGCLDRASARSTRSLKIVAETHGFSRTSVAPYSIAFEASFSETAPDTTTIGVETGNLAR